jgi:hypothetical protein
MTTKPFGVVLIGALCLIAGLAGLAGFWVATEAGAPGTSPLAQLFTMAWSIAFILVSVLLWRRSRIAPPVFLVAMAFPVVLMRFVVPGGQAFVPSLVAASLVGVLGYRYLRRAGQRLA